MTFSIRRRSYRVGRDMAMPWHIKRGFIYACHQCHLKLQTLTMSKKSTWCFTVRHGLHAPTSEEGESVQYSSKLYKVVLGPVEQPDSNLDYPHQHGYIQCPPACSLTKGQAIALLKQFGAYEEGNYVHELESTRGKYHSYCFKSLSSAKSSVERAIKRCMESIEKDNLKVTPKRLKAALSEREGAMFVTKNKGCIDTMMATPEVYNTRKLIINETVDSATNLKNYRSAITTFRKAVKTALENGFVTTHPAFADCSRKDQVNAIVIIALLPSVCQRKRVTDKIPGLFFWGNPHCGKSFLFSQMPCYKKVSTDAEGVSRYRMEGEQSGFLIDDVDADWLFRPSNQKTLKALSIGETEQVKTFGETTAVRGFVVMTSNVTPDFLRDGPTLPVDVTPEETLRLENEFKINANAWKRRMLAVHFTEPIEAEADFIDFDCIDLDALAKSVICEMCASLESPTLKDLFHVYHSNIFNSITDEQKELVSLVFDDDE